MSKKPTVLMILDGYGLSDKMNGNAVAEANTPVMDQLMAEYPFVRGNASGMAVGLPEGQMGNSEVGHLNMGAGRIVYQDLTKITKAIQDGDFFENEALLAACANVKRMTVPCTCTVWYQTVVYTAIIRIFTDFWNWQSVRVSPKSMYTVSWTDVTLHRNPERIMCRNFPIR